MCRYLWLVRKGFSVKKIVVCSLSMCAVYAVRDPFSIREHSYHYTAHGVVHTTGESLAVLWIDGISYCVRSGTCVVGHKVSALSQERIILCDERGTEWQITKNPPT